MDSNGFAQILHDFQRIFMEFIDFGSPEAWVSGNLWQPVATYGNLWQPVGTGGLPLGALEASGETGSLGVAMMRRLRMTMLVNNDSLFMG